MRQALQVGRGWSSHYDDLQGRGCSRRVHLLQQVQQLLRTLIDGETIDYNIFRLSWDTRDSM